MKTIYYSIKFQVWNNSIFSLHNFEDSTTFWKKWKETRERVLYMSFYMYEKKKTKKISLLLQFHKNF